MEYVLLLALPGVSAIANRACGWDDMPGKKPLAVALLGVATALILLPYLPASQAAFFALAYALGFWAWRAPGTGPGLQAIHGGRYPHRENKIADFMESAFDLKAEGGGKRFGVIWGVIRGGIFAIPLWLALALATSMIAGDGVTTSLIKAALLTPVYSLLSGVVWGVGYYLSGLAGERGAVERAELMVGGAMGGFAVSAILGGLDERIFAF